MTHDDFKKVKRIVRTWLIEGLVKAMTTLDAPAVPKLKRLLMKIFPCIFKKEIARAYELLPAEFAPRKDEIIKKMCDNQIMTLLEVFFYEKLMAADPGFVRTEGTEYLKEAFEKQKGTIILTAHFGNWELVAYTIAALGYSLHVMTRPQAVDQMTKFMNSFRTGRGVNVLVDNLTTQSIGLLRQNKTIGLLCDLNAKKHGYRTTFFGREASFYPAPVLLALRTGAVVIPTFDERMPDGRHVIRFEAPIEFKRGDKMCSNVKHYVECYEAAFRRRPDQWCWFHERYEFAEAGRIG